MIVVNESSRTLLFTTENASRLLKADSEMDFEPNCKPFLVHVKRGLKWRRVIQTWNGFSLNGLTFRDSENGGLIEVRQS